MKISGVIPVHIFRSDKDTHFTGSLATDAGEDENLSILTGPKNVGMIEGVIIQSDQQLDWDVYFFSKDTFDDTDLDADSFLGMVKFIAADGKQIAAANQYYYSTVNSSYAFRPFTYIDEDSTQELHIKLVNRSATAKNSGATGEVVVGVVFRPDQG